MVRKGLWSGARFYTMAEADLLAVVSVLYVSAFATLSRYRG